MEFDAAEIMLQWGRWLKPAETPVRTGTALGEDPASMGPLAKASGNQFLNAEDSEELYKLQWSRWLKPAETVGRHAVGLARGGASMGPLVKTSGNFSIASPSQ